MELIELIIFANFWKELLQQLWKLANFRHVEPSYRFAHADLFQCTCGPLGSSLIVSTDFQPAAHWDAWVVAAAHWAAERKRLFLWFWKSDWILLKWLILLRQLFVLKFIEFVCFFVFARPAADNVLSGWLGNGGKFAWMGGVACPGFEGRPYLDGDD